jgi:uncharacterized metal-binding protein
MPSGKTHDRITLGCLPGVCLVAHLVTDHWGYTLLVTTAYLFAGFMFGPDLDIRSIQSKRWGWLRWIWLPYRNSLRHRSRWSHGFLAGTIVRLVYLLVWIMLGILLVLEISNASGRTSVTWNELGQTVGQTLGRHWRVWLAMAIGLELGAMSHYFSDWMVSAWKRERRKNGSQRRSPSKGARRSPRKKSR